MKISFRTPLFSLVFLVFSAVFAANSLSRGISSHHHSATPKIQIAEGADPVPKTPPTKPPTSRSFSA